MSRALHAFDMNRHGPVPVQQQRVLDFARSVVSAGKPFPSPREIAAYMGWKSEGSALDCLSRLAWRGHVSREKTEGKRLSASQRYVWKLTRSAGPMTEPTAAAHSTEQ